MENRLHWTNHWGRISEHIARRRSLLIGTDFDATLAPTAATPAQTVVPMETRALLRRLRRCAGIHIGVVSGRALSDVQMRVGIEGLFYAGNHGLEFSGPGVHFHSRDAARTRGEFECLIASLVAKTATLDGVFIEEKGMSALVYWRLASEEVREKARAILGAAIAQYPRFGLSCGKDAWELRPKGAWNIGEAITHLMTRLRLAPEEVIYIGDGLGDEDSFRALSTGLTFHVGGKNTETAAHYRIHDFTDVQAFLFCLLGMRSRMHVEALESAGLEGVKNIDPRVRVT